MLAGFDTTALTLTNASYVLATNPEIQDTLYQKVMDKIEEHVSEPFPSVISKKNEEFSALSGLIRARCATK